MKQKKKTQIEVKSSGLPQSHLIGSQLSFVLHGCVNLTWINTHVTNIKYHLNPMHFITTFM